MKGKGVSIVVTDYSDWTEKWGAMNRARVLRMQRFNDGTMPLLHSAKLPTRFMIVDATGTVVWDDNGWPDMDVMKGVLERIVAKR